MSSLERRATSIFSNAERFSRIHFMSSMGILSHFFTDRGVQRSRDPCDSGYREIDHAAGSALHARIQFYEGRGAPRPSRPAGEPALNQIETPVWRLPSG